MQSSNWDLPLIFFYFILILCNTKAKIYSNWKSKYLASLVACSHHILILIAKYIVVSCSFRSFNQNLGGNWWLELLWTLSSRRLQNFFFKWSSALLPLPDSPNLRMWPYVPRGQFLEYSIGVSKYGTVQNFIDGIWNPNQILSKEKQLLIQMWMNHFWEWAYIATPFLHRSVNEIFS